MEYRSIFHFVYFLMFSATVAIGVPLPFSVPPQPEQPALLRVAPKDCMAFLSWSGSRPADPKSTNQAEQLAAEPEIRAMLAQLQQAVLAAVGREGGAEGTLLQRMVEACCAGLQRPGCVFVQRVQYKPTHELAAGLVLKLDDAMPAAKTVMTGLSLALLKHRNGAAPVEDVDIDGVRFHALPLPKPEVFLGWAELDGWFALAVGEDVAKQIVAGLQNRDQGLQQNAVYARLAPACSVAQPCTRAFVDVPAVLAVLEQSGDDDWLALCKALGLGNATGMVSVAGLEDRGFTSRLRLGVPTRTGMLASLTGKPLSQDELLQIPRDANVAVAARLDASRLDSSILDVCAAFFGADVRTEYENGFAKAFSQRTGVDWREQLLAQLGDQITIWNAPSQGGALFTGAMASIRLQDGVQFADALGRAMDALAQFAPSKTKEREAGRRLRRGQYYLDRFTHKDRTCWWTDSFDPDFPFGMTWTASKEHALFGLMPQAVKATLDAEALPNPDRSLLRLPELNQRGDAVAMTWLDLGATMQLGYPTLLTLLQIGAAEWQREGFDFDLADLPRPEALVPHLGRELTLLELQDSGVMLRRHGTLPTADPLFAALAVGFASMLADL